MSEDGHFLNNLQLPDIITLNAKQGVKDNDFYICAKIASRYNTSTRRVRVHLNEWSSDSYF